MASTPSDSMADSPDIHNGKALTTFSCDTHGSVLPCAKQISTLAVQAMTSVAHGQHKQTAGGGVSPRGPEFRHQHRMTRDLGECARSSKGRFKVQGFLTRSRIKRKQAPAAAVGGYEHISGGRAVHSVDVGLGTNVPQGNVILA